MSYQSPTQEPLVSTSIFILPPCHTRHPFSTPMPTSKICLASFFKPELSFISKSTTLPRYLYSPFSPMQKFRKAPTSHHIRIYNQSEQNVSRHFEQEPKTLSYHSDQTSEKRGEAFYSLLAQTQVLVVGVRRFTDLRTIQWIRKRGQYRY